jgi:hypothetical protein
MFPKNSMMKMHNEWIRKTSEKNYEIIMTHPVGEPGEAKPLWVHDLQPQNAGELFKSIEQWEFSI